MQTSSGPLLADHAVVATGFDAVPKLPDWPGRDQFEGELIHAAEYRSPQAYRGREVLIVGAGNTGIDIAGHLIAGGANVTVAMRTPPNVFPRDWLGYPLALSTVPLEKLPSRIGDPIGRMTQRMIFGDLSKYGITRAPEGFLSRFRRTLQGPAVDDGFIAALKAGRTRIVPTVARFEGQEVELVDGTRLTPDAVICATGYGRGLEPIVGHLGVLREDGLPEAYDGAADPAAPGLYFAGFFGLPSGQIKIFGSHARRIARAAARDREASG
jgi:cation diffusion facilitator CzcD-associated flavoprotein CzcO